MLPVQETTNPHVSALERAPLVSAVVSAAKHQISLFGGGRDVNRALETLTCDNCTKSCDNNN